MSLTKVERIAKLFRDCEDCDDHRNRRKNTINSSVKNRQGKEGKYDNNVPSLNRLMPQVQTNTARELDFTSPRAKLKRNFSRSHRKDKILFTDDLREALSSDLEEFICSRKWRTASVEFSHLYRIMAIAQLEQGNRLAALRLLTESHAVMLQQHILHRYIKTVIRNEYSGNRQEPGLKPIFMQFQSDSVMQCDSLRKKLAEMPPEWYMLQITVQYHAPDYQRTNGTIVESMSPLHITVLPTGAMAADPFCITLPNPDNGEYDGISELVNIVKNNKADLEAFYASNMFYWKMRDKQNSTLKSAVMDIENNWLREWRILLVADPMEDSESFKEMRIMIDKLISDDMSVVPISDSTRWLLRKIAISCCFLSKSEIARAVSYVLHDNQKLAKNVILSIYGRLFSVEDLRRARRKTLIMIVDESIDHLPFEYIGVLRTHPVTRFPSFNIAYAMFKEHENTIVNGCNVVKRGEAFGSFIVNPESNLNKMEKRIKLFIDYWLPQWKGSYGTAPTQTSYEEILLSQDVFLYAGHGSGIQYLPGEKIEKLKVRSSVFLFGCSSVKLNPTGGIFPPRGVSDQYLIACSPCILGMLWEVTDGDIDKMMAKFITDWIPSNANRPWSDVDETKWIDGLIKFKTPASQNIVELITEPEMLRAVAKAKTICTQDMTCAAIIVRGLPLIIES